MTNTGRYYLTDCATSSGTWRRVAEEQGRDRWEKLRQGFAESEDLLRLGDHRCTLAELLRDLDMDKAGKSGAGDGGGSGAGGRERSVEAPKGRVERDPLTGEIVPKRF